MEQTFMKEKKILPLVLSMSLPMMLSMLVNSLYNIVDSYFVAQISEQAMTALSLVYPLQLLETAIAVGFGVGMNAAAAYYLGAKEQQRADDIVTSGLILSLLHGVILMAAALLFAPAFVSLFTENKKILADGVKYSNLVFIFAVPNVIAITFEKIFQAEGRMKVSMFSMLCGCVANIILDPLLIFGIGIFPKMGIEGAAIATGIGQVIPLIVYLFVFIKHPVSLHFHWHKKVFQKRLMGQMYGVGIPATLNLALPSFMITALNGILAVYSASYVLVLGIYYKLQTFIYLTANGIVQGIRPLVGYNYGAGEYDRVKKIAHTSMGLIALVMVMGMAISCAIPQQLMGIFTDDSQTIIYGAEALKTYFFGFVFMSFMFTGQSTFTALGYSKHAIFFSLLRKVIIVTPLAIILPRIGFGVMGVFLSEPVSNVIGGLASFLTMYFTVYRKLKPQNTDLPER